MNILGFKLENEEKIERAKHGTIIRGGQVVLGGLDQMIQQGKLKEPVKPEKGASKEEEKAYQETLEAYNKALLAEYDRLGGFVTKDGVKVKSGSFYDFQKKVARTEFKPTFLSDVEGENMALT